MLYQLPHILERVRCPCEEIEFFEEFFVRYSIDHRVLHSFPTRRSSDLPHGQRAAGRRPAGGVHREILRRRGGVGGRQGEIGRHTSELQSQSNLVCRLLLEKKNQRISRASFDRIESGSKRLPQFLR